MENTKPVVAYVPFKTFLTALESLERALPNQIDRSLWPSYSGAIQGQLLGALRFLGLMDGTNCPSAELREMVARREVRKAVLRRVLEMRYAPLIELDLTRTSPRQLEEAMRQYGLNGATHKKALSFFLQAATYAEVPLSALLRETTRGTHRRSAAPAGTAARAAVVATEPAPSIAKTVRLKSGGALTLIAAADLFSLAAEDRAFVFEMVDRLRKYEAAE